MAKHKRTPREQRLYNFHGFAFESWRSKTEDEALHAYLDTGEVTEAMAQRDRDYLSRLEVSREQK